MNKARYSVAAWLLVFGVLNGTFSAAQETIIERGVLAEQYANCAAYYLMMSKADPKLHKLARVGEVAADNARVLSDAEKTLDMMAIETRRMLAKMSNDWGNVGVVVDEKATSCKALMVAN